MSEPTEAALATLTAALTEAREKGRAAYLAEIVAALDCHPALVLQEIARLREVASEAVTLDEVRQREQRAREEGRREERRACWDVAERRRTAHAEYLLFAAAGQPRIDASTRASEAALVRDAIATRGPMGPTP